MISGAPAVEEVQGLYGPFSFTEKALQKIWLRGDFDRGAARLADGRLVRVLHPGKWNLLGGPDFNGARFVLGDGPPITGDVELHLRAGDWVAHRHAEDRAYDRVALHVVLFPPERGCVTRGAAGGEIPLLVLLPLLPHDLEEFAADESVEALAGKSLGNAPEELASLEPQELLALLRRHAARRWRRKVHFARVRQERLGWETACHSAALETLGYRFNRPPMLRIAERWPLSAWTRGAVDVNEIFASEAGAWSVQGVRPANLPRVRLRQYAAWTCAVPDWPERWSKLGDQIPPIASEASTRELRRLHRFGAWRKQINESVCGGVLGGTRLDNFVCDALLSLHAAACRESFDFGAWFNWFPGDQPPTLMRVLHQLGVCDGGDQPLCHGFAQGLLDWFIAHDARR
jgi:Protein of unknown function (DUF2851)